MDVPAIITRSVSEGLCYGPSLTLRVTMKTTKLTQYASDAVLTETHRLCT
jgi:hypothetical protein